MFQNFQPDQINSKHFRSMARTLLNRYVLIINGKKYRLIEIEFYLCSQIHPDSYAHTNPEQLLLHSFYFHRFPNGTYKAGNYLGLDLTFGDPDTETYFGILIRAIEDIETGVVTEGPCNTVRKILSECHCNSIQELVQDRVFGLFDSSQMIYLEKDTDLETRTLYRGSRIGLSNKYPEFLDKPYRYVADRSKIRKKKSTLVLC